MAFKVHLVAFKSLFVRIKNSLQGFSKPFSVIFEDPAGKFEIRFGNLKDHLLTLKITLETFKDPFGDN